MVEVWHDVKGYEGLYQVSNLGRVKSLERNIKMRQYVLHTVEKIMKPIFDGKGYNQITLCKSGKMKRISIHRLVATHFIPNTENKPFINHINGIKTDNRVENLEWCTPSENNLHMYRVLGHKGTMLGRKASEETRRKIIESNNKPVLCIELNQTFPSAKAASLWLKMSPDAVSASIRKHCKCKGYTWTYIKKG